MYSTLISSIYSSTPKTHCKLYVYPFFVALKIKVSNADSFKGSGLSGPLSPSAGRVTLGAGRKARVTEKPHPAAGTTASMFRRVTSNESRMDCIWYLVCIDLRVPK